MLPVREKETRNKNDDLKGSRENGICMTARRMGITAVVAGSEFVHVATAANGWHAVKVGSQVGWVSGKYSEITTE